MRKMELTEQEKKIVLDAFQATRKHFDEELVFEDKKDIIKALIFYHDKLHMPKNHVEIMHEIFKKMGLWHDGKTTLDERKRQLYEKKTSYERKVSLLAQKQTNRIEEIQKILEEKKREILTVPQKIKEDVETQGKMILTNVENALAEFKRIKENKVARIIREYELETAEEIKKMKDKAYSDLEKIKNLQLRKAEQEIEESMKEMNGLFSAVLQETGGITMEKHFEEEIKSVEDELFELEGLPSFEELEEQEASEPEIQEYDYEAHTIAELKLIAENRGITDIPYRILKADLINMLKNKEEIIFEE